MDPVQYIVTRALWRGTAAAWHAAMNEMAAYVIGEQLAGRLDDVEAAGLCVRVDAMHAAWTAAHGELGAAMAAERMF